MLSSIANVTATPATETFPSTKVIFVSVCLNFNCASICIPPKSIGMFTVAFSPSFVSVAFSRIPFKSIEAKEEPKSPSTPKIGSKRPITAPISSIEPYALKSSKARYTRSLPYPIKRSESAISPYERLSTSTRADVADKSSISILISALPAKESGRLSFPSAKRRTFKGFPPVI